MAEIDIGQITEALNDKTDRDMRNVDTTAKADAVIDYQEPTADNGYTWYRKYASGWVEQGGCSDGSGSWGLKTITLTVEMRDAYYTLTITSNTASGDFTDDGTSTRRGASRSCVTNRTTISFQHQSNNMVSWQVSGMAAI